MPNAHVNLKRALNPFTHPLEAAKAPAYILYHRLQGGGNFGFLYTSPWGTYDTLKWLFKGEPKPLGMPGLEVGSTDSGTEGFAIYGTVRVSGTNVVPPC